MNSNLESIDNVLSKARELGMGEKSIVLLEEQMRNGVDRIAVTDLYAAKRGQVEATTFINQSNRSENYYISKFQVAYNQGKVLDEGLKFFVTLPERDGEKRFQGIEGTLAAIDLFKQQKGESALSYGKTFGDSQVVATMTDGKIDSINAEFQRTFRLVPRTQTVWLDRGKGTSIPQGANLIQGKYVHRDDMLNSLKGEIYSAWIKYDFDSPKFRDNYQVLQFSGEERFDPRAELEKYNIKELADPKQFAALETRLSNGDSPVITAIGKDGKGLELTIEVEARYKKLNFFDKDGGVQKREQFLKEPGKNMEINSGKKNDKKVEKDAAASQEMSR
ncbi:hypothetical protein SAMN05421820_101478 [Pedobacter steynii]|uniref:Uncharacterized protein n=1 Tax=Pedobacter steynii TaxID=430522 RepID=A0A1G9K5C4_9SPHI|nr:hypothetical protein [Pedobacter steynii]NQX38457.1 hypothetical protein [Pedobacter steynii]SDL45100.1 hypothetical protein SAMN05421820_101478 [Pedobacter steynii]